MGIYAKDIVKQAESWIGCKESNGTHKKIIDVYNAHKPLARGYAVKYVDAWCATFVSAVAIKCDATSIIPTECGCNQMIELFKEIGCWVENENRKPEAGDIIFYDWQDKGNGDNKGSSDHVGIVQKVSGSTIYVIEGNYDNSVKIRKIAVNGRYIRGYGVPKYDVDNALDIGDKVKLTSDAKYYDGKTIPSWVFKRTLYVREVSNNRIVISILKKGAITGAVDKKYLRKI